MVRVGRISSKLFFFKVLPFSFLHSKEKHFTSYGVLPGLFCLVFCAALSKATYNALYSVTAQHVVVKCGYKKKVFECSGSWCSWMYWSHSHVVEIFASTTVSAGLIIQMYPTLGFHVWFYIQHLVNSLLPVCVYTIYRPAGHDRCFL